MGIIRQGIFGGFEGRTGPLVGRKVKGKSVISGLPHKATKPRTAAQIDQQLKFELVFGFLKWLKRLIAIGFRDPDGKKNSFNAAVKYNFKHIITGTSPDYGIDYSKLVFSKGSLAGPNSPSVSLGTNAIVINWQPDVQHQFSQHTDRASFLVYCPGKNAFVIKVSATERLMLGYSMGIPQDLTGYDMHVFMSFTSADEKVVSDSVYLGTI
ncbi:hypothetical protein HDC92_002321 [Pedobacter sp. AK017]|uniref:DUF6266 family protein n=1 Tax=Pedobacter sp. AK017 TaxID=2723073 RepID=UPI0016108BF5|nr:DUF6266 family protein [Pedobacter sp. AK017]MBB5438640.1 hypothetical protein [Pedobacter sp. AK017]